MYPKHRNVSIPSQVMCFNADGTSLKEAQVYDVVTIVEVEEDGAMVQKYVLKDFQYIVFDMSRFLPLWQFK